jgi:hypothetical protein
MTSGPERPDAAKGDQRSPDAMDCERHPRRSLFRTSNAGILEDGRTVATHRSLLPWIERIFNNLDRENLEALTDEVADCRRRVGKQIQWLEILECPNTAAAIAHPCGRC